jgi:hypothetical protein
MGTALKLAQTLGHFSFRVAIVWRSAIRQRTGAHMSAIAVVKNETERLVRNSFVRPLNYEHERPVTAAPSRAIRRQRPTPILTHHWPVTPIAAMPPSRDGADQHQYQNDQQNGS